MTSRFASLSRSSKKIVEDKDTKHKKVDEGG